MQLFSSWTGSDFLMFYITLLALCGAFASWIPHHLRKAGRRSMPDDLESIAFLAGGRDRLADSLLTDLHVRGALFAAESGQLVADVSTSELPESHAARELLAQSGPFTLADARKVIDSHTRRVTRRLQRAGLILRPEEQGRLRWLSITPFAALFMLGLSRQRAGSAVGEATEYLVALMALTVALAIIRYIKNDPRTASGIAAVKELQDKHDHAAPSPRAEDAALKVALFGTDVLVGTPWEPVHALRRKDVGSSGGGADASDAADGGGGCGD